jgi:transposase
MGRISGLLDDDVVNACNLGLKKLGKIGVVAGRLQIILAAKDHGITQVCRVHNISRTTVTDWIKRLKNGGIEALANKPKRPQSLLHPHEDTIKEMIEQDPNITIKKLIIMIGERLHIIVGQTAMRRVVKKLNFSYITPRPTHYKKKESDSAEFKKNLRTKYEKDRARPIFFFDEARFGTHSKLGHGWFKKGSRTPVKVKLGFQNFYLYSAINPSSGEDFTLILPKVNTNCMNIFLEEIARQYKNKPMTIVMDGAGWHKSKELAIPSSIEIIYLPPYSPELNPVERLWLYLKQNTIKNKIYDTLSDLEKMISNFILTLKQSIIKDICTADYLFN